MMNEKWYVVVVPVVLRKNMYNNNNCQHEEVVCSSVTISDITDREPENLRHTHT